MIFQTISVQILTLFNLFFVMRKNKFYHLYFLENARAYQIIKYHFKLNGENHVSAECIFYYTVVKLANDQVIVLFACQKCFNYRAGRTRGAGGASATPEYYRYTIKTCSFRRPCTTNKFTAIIKLKEIQKNVNIKVESLLSLNVSSLTLWDQQGCVIFVINSLILE